MVAQNLIDFDKEWSTSCGLPSSAAGFAMSVDHSLSKSMRFCATTWRSSE